MSKPEEKLTYGKLLELLKTFDEKRLSDEVMVYDEFREEYLPIHTFEEMGELDTSNRSHAFYFIVNLGRR